MNRGVRYVFTAAVLLAAAGVPASVAAQEPDIDGMYLSHGTNPDGSEYRGLVEVARHGDSFLVSWLTPERSNQVVRIARVSVGIGILNGDTLAVSYSAARAPGIVMYRIERGGQRLVGQWATLGDDGGVYAETLQKLPPSAALPEPDAGTPQESAPTRPAPDPPARYSI